MTVTKDKSNRKTRSARGQLPGVFSMLQARAIDVAAAEVTPNPAPVCP